MTLKETLNKYLVGRRITSIDGRILRFDDGTTLRIYKEAQDCNSETFWEILEPNLLVATITNVEYEEGNDIPHMTCRITIFHNEHPVALGEGNASLLLRPSWKE